MIVLPTTTTLFLSLHMTMSYELRYRNIIFGSETIIFMVLVNNAINSHQFTRIFVVSHVTYSSGYRYGSNLLKMKEEESSIQRINLFNKIVCQEKSVRRSRHSNIKTWFFSIYMMASNISIRLHPCNCNCIHWIWKDKMTSGK